MQAALSIKTKIVAQFQESALFFFVVD